jgi:hypothetical protein
MLSTIASHVLSEKSYGAIVASIPDLFQVT